MAEIEETKAVYIKKKRIIKGITNQTMKDSKTKKKYFNFLN